MFIASMIEALQVASRLWYSGNYCVPRKYKSILASRHNCFVRTPENCARRRDVSCRIDAVKSTVSDMRSMGRFSKLRCSGVHCV